MTSKIHSFLVYKAEEVLERQRDAHEGVVLHPLDVHQRVGLHDALRQHVLAEHLPAARHLVRRRRWHVDVDVGDIELAHQWGQLGGFDRVRAAVALEDCGIHVEQLGAGFFCSNRTTARATRSLTSCWRCPSKYGVRLGS